MPLKSSSSVQKHKLNICGVFRSVALRKIDLGFIWLSKEGFTVSKQKSLPMMAEILEWRFHWLIYFRIHFPTLPCPHSCLNLDRSFPTVIWHHSQLHRYSNTTWTQWLGHVTQHRADFRFGPSQWEMALLCNRTDCRFVPSQWETPLLCNKVSHWLGTSLESALAICGHRSGSESIRQWLYSN